MRRFIAGLVGLLWLTWALSPAWATTIYIIGSGSGSFTPKSTATATVECWGAGQAGGTSGGNGGNGAGYSKKNTLNLTAGTPVPFQLGTPGITSGAAGGDTWFSSSATVIANGGG